MNHTYFLLIGLQRKYGTGVSVFPDLLVFIEILCDS